jgi:hypothetical protein
MPGQIDLLYTTIGGVIGAGLTQYVTHLRDRRAARALVIERIADVEEAFAVLRWTVPKDAYPPGTSQMASKLAALEASSLIAGVPRSILVCYTSTFVVMPLRCPRPGGWRGFLRVSAGRGDMA